MKHSKNRTALVAASSAGSAAGRPTTYTKVVGERITARIAEGKSLREICRADGIRRGTVYEWVARYPEFADQYARACEIRADVLFDQLQEIAGDGRNDWIVSGDPENPSIVLNAENVQRFRLRVDTLKWRLSKMLPRKYGDRTVLEHAFDGESLLTLIQEGRERALKG